MATTSQLAYKHLKESGSIDERNALVMRFFEELGGAGTSPDIIRHAETSNAFKDGESRYRFQQNVYAAVSELSAEGYLKCTGQDVNPSSGQKVKFYEINRGEIVAVEPVEKGYKKRFQDLERNYNNTKKLLDEQEQLLEEFRASTVVTDQVRDAFRIGIVTSDWASMKVLLGTK